MADEKPEIEGQDQAATEVAGAPTELSMEELTKRIEEDASFADDFIQGKVVVKRPESEPPKTEEPKPVESPETAKPVEPVAPAVAPTPGAEAVTKDDDGKFVVKFEDGSTKTYASKPEALKALREQEHYIRRSKEAMSEMRRKLAEQNSEIERLKAAVPAKPAEAAVPESKPEEELDPLAPDYLEKLGKILAENRKEIAELKKARAADKQEIETDRQRRDREVVQEREKKNRFSEIGSFVSRHEEFKTEKPIDVLHAEYSEFFRELGALAGTDGRVESNKAIMDVYLDAENSEMGKKLKAEAEKIGLRPPAELDKLFNVLRLVDRRNKLAKHDEVTGQMVPFTLEETYEYLQAREGRGGSAAQVPGSPGQSKPEMPASPAAEALAAAEALKGKVATDIPSAGSASAAPSSVASMSAEQLEQILDTPKHILRSNPERRKIWEDVYRIRLKQAVPRLEGIS